MKEWWAAREPREQWLIQLAGVILVLVVAIQFVLLPILRSHAANQTAYETGLRNQVATTGYLHALEASTAQPQTANGGATDLRSRLTQIAQIRGLTINRLQTSRQGTITVVIDEADPRLLFSWLTEVQAVTGVRPIAAQVFGRGESRVRASIDFPQTEGGS